MTEYNTQQLAYFDGQLYQREWIYLSINDLFYPARLDWNKDVYSDDIYIASGKKLAFKPHLGNNLDVDAFIEQVCERSESGDLFLEQYAVDETGIEAIDDNVKIQYSDCIECYRLIPPDDPDYDLLFAAYQGRVNYDVNGQPFYW